MFKELDPLLHSQLRLAIVSLLMSVEEADFVFIREKTGATAGNLSVQLTKLSEAGYIEVHRELDGRKTRTRCRMTTAGAVAFEQYVHDLQSYINLNNNES